MQHTKKSVVTIFGGSGFVGTQVVQELSRKGYRIRVAVRRPDLAGHLKPLGMVGQIQPIQANVRNPASVERAIAGSDIVINLAGILFEAGRQRFRAVHTMGASTIGKAAKAAGVKTMVHMSALGADPESPSLYFRSKALGEAEMLKAFPNAVIIRPSLVFGQGDGFFNLFGALGRLLPVLPVVGAKTHFQPVYVGDVAEAIALAAVGKVKPGKIYELGGAETESMQDLMARLVAGTGRNNMLLPLPAGIAGFMASFAQLLPSPILTTDQVTQLQIDNVVSDDARKQKRTLAAFGIVPITMETILPTYLWQFRKHGQFENAKA